MYKVSSFMLDNFADIFQKVTSRTLTVSNSLDPDQAQHTDGPDHGPDCKDNQQMTKFAASRQRVNPAILYILLLVVQ